jgi:hypothetical protein
MAMRAIPLGAAALSPEKNAWTRDPRGAAFCRRTGLGVGAPHSVEGSAARLNTGEVAALDRFEARVRVLRHEPIRAEHRVASLKWLPTRVT